MKPKTIAAAGHGEGEGPRTFSWHQDLALAACQARHPVCPFGCVKDGAPNCDFNVRTLDCEPGRETAEAATVLALARSDRSTAEGKSIMSTETEQRLRAKAAKLKAEEQKTLMNSLLADMHDRKRLEALSDFELIRETINHNVADDNRVLELMARVYPKWEDEPEPPSMPERPRVVCVALPIDVAHDVVAFSECHCGEAVATGEDVEVPENRPCLYCACQAALYRATKLEMYKPDQ